MYKVIFQLSYNKTNKPMYKMGKIFDQTLNKRKCAGLSGGPVVKTSPSNAGVLIWSPVKELRAHMPISIKPQNRKQKQYFNKFNIVVQLLSPTGLCNHMDCSMPGFPVIQSLLEFVQTHVHWVSDDLQPSHPLLPP